MIDLIINELINNFDFTYMFLINVLTYIIIKIVNTSNKEKQLSILLKRVLLVCSIIIITGVYKILGYTESNIILLNSAILAPVSWSWIFKPIINKFKLGYNG